VTVHVGPGVMCTQMEEEKARQMEESAAFDQQLESVCEQLKSDCKFYSKENLSALMADKDRENEELRRKSMEVNDQVVEASRQLEQLLIDNGTNSSSSDICRLVPWIKTCFLENDLQRLAHQMHEHVDGL
jgi:hypothetical protein